MPQAAQPRETQECQIAMALELWKQQQEEHFQHEVKVKPGIKIYNNFLICPSLRMKNYIPGNFCFIIYFTLT